MSNQIFYEILNQQFQMYSLLVINYTWSNILVIYVFQIVSWVILLAFMPSLDLMKKSFYQNIHNINNSTVLIILNLIMKILLNFILVNLILLGSLCKKLLHYHQMNDGTFMIALNYDLSKNQTALRHQLNKHFHLPKKKRNLSHQKVEYDNEMKNFQTVDIYKSADKQYFLNIRDSCLGGKSGLTGKNKLQEFRKSKCSPVVIVPGILATTLILEIDCQKLKQYDGGKIFEECGWTTCFNLGIQKPDQQYLLWIGLDLTLKVTGGQSRCFGDLFGLLYNQNSTQKQFGNRYYTPAGLKSTWFGNTIKSFNYSKCGSNAIRDLSGHVSILSILGSQCALNDYARLIDTLQVMGYDSGLTLQAMPYDFRYGILASKTPTILSQTIKNLFDITGKKVVIVAHSLGTLHTLSHLSFFMTKQEKQMMVRHYIPITPPWFGTVSAIRNVLYGDATYFTNGGAKSGINKYAQHKFSLTSGSTYQLFLKDAFKIYREQPWMQQILKRISYQKQGRTKNITYGPNQNLQNGEQDYPLNWFPSKYQKCFDEFFKNNSYCQTGFIDFVNTPIFKIKGKQYFGTSDDIQKLLKQSLNESQFKIAMSVWAQTKVQNKSLNTIPAPGVDTSMVFTTVYKTQIYYEYDELSKDDKGDQNQFLLASKTNYTPGDISVPSFSPLIFLSKWLHDNSNDNHLIKAIQYCGNYTGNKSHYSTISCECKQNPFKNQLDCTHPCIISDKFLISYVLKILTNSDSGYQDDKARHKKNNFTELSDDQIEQIMRQCPNLRMLVKVKEDEQ